jgi:proteic killer suppression protein
MGPVRPLVGATAGRKHYQLNQARMLRDLALPGNQLEALKGDRAGQYSIRVNDQFRVCFIWRDGDACDVEIVDYHRREKVWRGFWIQSIRARRCRRMF